MKDIDDLDAFPGIEPMNWREVRDEGGRWRPRSQRRPMTDDQRAALAAALAADDDIPSRLYPRRPRYSGGFTELGPSHLSTDRIRRTPLPSPPPDETVGPRG